MTNNLLQWTAIIIEFIGLVLITLELYFQQLSESLKSLFEEAKPRVMANPKKWIGSFIIIWVIAVIVLSLWDQTMSIIANVIFTVFTILVILMLGISKMLIRLGVILGRGNSVGGVGLVLAIIGLSLEIVQLVLT
ncbi:MAG: hypothetical protein GY808_01010 [Gammaproteobacteria bacterium]|nr:hypothetical protein [Gammaproteobacteria bacterium]